MTLGRMGVVWGVVGVVALLSSAVVRLFPIAAEPLGGGMTVGAWIAYAASMVLLGWAEGYRAFQKGFSPRVVARAQYLAHHPRVAHVVFAPLFCMGLFHATRRRLLASRAVLVGVVGLVVAVHAMSQPWRGAVDAGVVVGLTWGVLAIIVFAVRALRGAELPVPPDVPS